MSQGSQQGSSLLPLIVKTGLVAAGSAYIIYKYLWSPSIKSEQESDDQPHWSEVVSKKPSPENFEDDDDFINTIPAVQTSLSSHTISEEEFYSILKWFEEIDVNGYESLSFDLLADALLENLQIARLLIEHNGLAATTQDLTTEIIKETLFKIPTESTGVLSKSE